MITDSKANCSHVACVQCWGKWVDGQLDKCRAAKALRVPCFACTKALPQKMTLAVAGRVQTG